MTQSTSATVTSNSQQRPPSVRYSHSVDLAIQAQDLRKTYREGWFGRRKFQALNGVSFHVPVGKVFGLLGPNGAGKTTFVKTLLGIIRKTSGQATVFGHPAGSLKARQNTGYLPERLALPSYLTGYQALEYCGGLSGLSGGAVRARRDEMLELVGLEGWGKSQIRKYSKGMVQRLGLAQAMIHRPKLLILDEPTDGLDPKARAGVRQILHRLSSEGITVFLNSHLLQEVEAICQDVAILHEGNLRYCGPVAAVGQYMDKAKGLTRGLEVKLQVAGPAKFFDQWYLQVMENSAASGAPVSVLGSANPSSENQDAATNVPIANPVAPLANAPPREAISLVEPGVWEWQETLPEQSLLDHRIDGLRAAGLSIRAIMPSKRTLEDAFLDMVGHEVPAGSTADSIAGRAMEQAGRRTT